MIISIVSLIVSLVLLIRIFLLDKEYGSIEVDVINPSDMHSSTPQNGYQWTAMNIDFAIVKSDIYDIQIHFREKNNSTFKTNGFSKVKMKEDARFNIDVVSNVKVELYFLFSDKMNNRYIQELFLTPSFFDNEDYSKASGYIVKLAKRKWLKRKSIKRYLS